MKRDFFILIWIVVLGNLITFSCTEPISLTNDGMDPMMVITCILTDTLSEHYAHQILMENHVLIQKTTHFFGDQVIEYIEDAKVWLNSESLLMSGPGVYSLKGFQPLPGETYTLEIHYDINEDGIDEIFTSSTTMPQECHLDSVALYPLFEGRSDYLAALVLFFKGNSGENYYGARLNNDVSDRFFSSRLLRYSLFQFDMFFGESTYKRLPMDWFISHEMSYDNDSKYHIYAGDTLSVTLESLSKEYHRFLKVARDELNLNNPLFSGPSSNVPSNISGGALGIFGAYTSSSAKIVLPLNTPGLPKRP